MIFVYWEAATKYGSYAKYKKLEPQYWICNRSDKTNIFVKLLKHKRHYQTLKHDLINGECVIFVNSFLPR